MTVIECSMDFLNARSFLPNMWAYICFIMQAMIRGELEVLKDWCYEAVRTSVGDLLGQLPS